MQNVVQTFQAEASDLQSSKLYMTVRMVMLTSPSPNLNGVRCTAAFINEIVANQDKYVTLPLVVDTQMLERGKYDKLSHNYDRKTDSFDTSIIGSFYRFESEVLDNGETALIGYARISKRNKETCKAISQLFAENNLKFSFEISAGDYRQLEDGTLEIDVSENNYLESLCVVSFPACVDAVAMQLVAEAIAIDMRGKEADVMVDEKVIFEEEKEVVAEQESAVDTEVVEETVAETTEEEIAEVSEETAKKEEAEEKDAEKEDVSCKKKNCGEEETAACKKKKCGEDDEEAPEEEPVDESNTNEDDKDTKKNAEIEVKIAALIAAVESLNEELSNARKEIAELRDSQSERIVAEVTSAINPFMGSIKVEGNAHEDFLKAETKSEQTIYSLLETV